MSGVVGVDIGGTKTAVGTPGQLLGVWPTPGSGPALVELIGTALEGRGAALSRLGVCVAGRVDPVRGTTRAANLPALAGFPLRDVLSAALRVPVTLVNDADAAALAEHRAGSARGAETSVFVTVSTGIGAAYVSGSGVLRGAHGQAMELGHLPSPGAHGPCHCGRLDCLELVASGSAITRALRVRLNRPGAAPPELAALAAAGAPGAQEVLDAAGQALGEALLPVGLTLDPDVIVIGGGAALAYGDRLLNPVREALRRALRPWPGPDVRPARLGVLAGVTGAALAARDAARDAAPVPAR